MKAKHQEAIDETPKTKTDWFLILNFLIIGGGLAVVIHTIDLILREI